MKTSTGVYCLCVVAVGCSSGVRTEPPAPEPVTIITPTDGINWEPGSSPSPTGTAVDATSLQGKWMHTMPGKDDGNRTVVLAYVRDQDGHERFQFVRHPWSHEPVFVEHTKDENEAILLFRLSQDDAGKAESSLHTVRYVLNKDGDRWTGKLFESWNDVPSDVVLVHSREVPPEK